MLAKARSPEAILFTSTPLNLMDMPGGDTPYWMEDLADIELDDLADIDLGGDAEYTSEATDTGGIGHVQLEDYPMDTGLSLLEKINNDNKDNKPHDFVIQFLNI